MHFSDALRLVGACLISLPSGVGVSRTGSSLRSHHLGGEKGGLPYHPGHSAEGRWDVFSGGNLSKTN